VSLSTVSILEPEKALWYVSGVSRSSCRWAAITPCPTINPSPMTKENNWLLEGPWCFHMDLQWSASQEQDITAYMWLSRSLPPNGLGKLLSILAAFEITCISIYHMYNLQRAYPWPREIRKYAILGACTCKRLRELQGKVEWKEILACILMKLQFQGWLYQGQAIDLWEYLCIKEALDMQYRLT
jgi:hypothetical protein